MSNWASHSPWPCHIENPLDEMVIDKFYSTGWENSELYEFVKVSEEK